MRILVTGANGFVGKNLVPKLERAGHETITPSRADYNLLEQEAIRRLFKDCSADAVIHLAAKVGGILANRTRPGEFIYENLAINTMFLEEARRAGIDRLLYPFGGCSYAKNSTTPIREESLFTGLPDENSMFYSLGKAVSHMQIVAYRRQYNLDWVSLIPGNIYGPHDNFSEKNSHVIPGLIHRFHSAKERGEERVEVWGSGSPIRDFIYIEDVADAFILALEKHHEELPINISSGIGVSIKDTVETIKRVVGFEGEIFWDATKPDGHKVKVFDVSRMRNLLKFEPKVSLDDGITKTYEWFRNNADKARL